MKRLFVAMLLRRETIDALLIAQAELARFVPSAADRYRLVKREAMHLTLKFLGTTPDEMVSRLIQELKTVADQTPPVQAIVAKIGAFPNLDRPKAVFGGITTGAQQVIELSDAIENACTSLGFAREHRPRVPHATLARVENPRATNGFVRWVEGHQATRFGPVEGEKIVLFESQMTHDGSTYVNLASLALGKK